MFYYSLPGYALGVRVRLRKKPGGVSILDKIKRLFALKFFLWPERPVKVSLKPRDFKVKTGLRGNGFSPFELALTAVKFSPARQFFSLFFTFLLFPALLGFWLKKPAFALEFSPRVEKGKLPTSEILLTKLDSALSPENFLEVSDCPLKFKPLLLAAADCVTAPHTFKLYNPTHINSSWANINVGATGHSNFWQNWPNTNIVPHTNTSRNVHSNIAPPAPHNNVDSGGYRRS